MLSSSKPAMASVWPSRISTVVVAARTFKPGVPPTVRPALIWLNSGETCSRMRSLSSTVGRKLMIAPKARKSVVTALSPAQPTMVGTANSPPAMNVAGRPLSVTSVGSLQEPNHAVLLQVADAELDVVAVEMLASTDGRRWSAVSSDAERTAWCRWPGRRS